jgi:rubrerythrin
MDNEKAKPLLTALKAERAGYNFYARMLNRSSNPTGADMFKSLMADEKKHIKIIEKRLKAIKCPPDTSLIAAKASLLSEIDFTDPSLSDFEIVEKAIKEEEFSLNFYAKAAEQAGSPEEKEMYLNLAQDEKDHVDRLEKEAQRLKNA